MGILKEMFNPKAHRELEKKEAAMQDGQPEVSAESLRTQRVKLEATVAKGEINRQDGALGQAVDMLENYILKNTPNELHKLSLTEVGELAEKFKLPYEKETILLVAQIFAAQRKEH